MNAAAPIDWRPEMPFPLQRPCVFLSASVPYDKTPDPDTPKTRDILAQDIATARPTRIRDAVVDITRALFAAGYGITFGAHPAISPLVLQVARETTPRPGDEPDDPLVVIWQSAWYRDQIPTSTLQLAAWDRGRWLLTAKASTKGESLQQMRHAMLSTGDIVAAVFIGGMDGVWDEAMHFAAIRPGRPMFALGSTGAAALRLLDAGHGTGGAHCTRHDLARVPSYPLIARKLLADLRPPDSTVP